MPSPYRTRLCDAHSCASTPTTRPQNLEPASNVLNGMSLPSTTTARASSRPQGSRWLLAAASIVSIALWYIPGAALVLYPVRLFVTFIHEGGHAVMTLITGGAVAGMAIHGDGSGVTYSAGGIPSLVYMAGYIGATAF